MKLALYAGASTVAAAGVILRALHERANFYSATVYLAQSNACLMILTNLALLIIGALMFGLQRVFYGTLRPIEVEQLYEKAWFAITETCLAMTIFREEVGFYLMVMFVSLLIGKVWGWIGEGRVEILEQQPPANPRLFHIRLSMSLLISIVYDLYMLLYSVQTVLEQARPNMMVVFAFEFAVLHVTSLSTAARYTLSLYEASVIRHQTKSRRDQIRQERAQAQQEPPSDGQQTTPVTGNVTDDDVENVDIDVPGWEEKGRWVFYLDLVTDFFRLVLYLTFFFVLCVFYGMPIHIIRDVALTIRSFYKRINDFLKYRQATRDMNDRYPDATPEEIAREDTCIICREDMRAWAQPPAAPNPPDANAQPTPSRTPLDERSRPKKLPCGHILHFACLRSWLERQQICPTCRRPVLATANGNQTSGPNAANQNGGTAPVPNQQQGPHAPNAAGRQPGLHQGAFNLGPFRFAFGARIGQGAIPQQINNPNAPNQGQLPGNAQGFGNPFNFFGQPQVPPQPTNARFTRMNIPAQLHHIEHHLMREINSLQMQANQLTMVRRLQGELARLRIQQAQNNQMSQPTGANGAANANPPGPPDTNGQVVPPMPPPVIGSMQPVAAFSSNPQQQSMGSGHPNLPQGMTLPEGWSVLPLQRVASANNQVGNVPPAGSSSQQPFIPQVYNLPYANQASSPVNVETTTSTSPLSHNPLDSIHSRSPAPASSASQQPAPTTNEASSQPPAPSSSAPESTPNTQDQISISIPNWGSEHQPQTNGQGNGSAIKVEPSPNTMNGTSIPSASTNYTEPPPTERREGKGKARAVTIEDEIEDVD